MAATPQRSRRSAPTAFAGRAVPLAAVAAAIFSLLPPGTSVAQAMDAAVPFRGVTHVQRTEVAPRPLRIDVLLIDLDDPEIRLRMTPPDNSPTSDTLLQTTLSYVREQGAQAGINVHFFSPCCPPAGTPADVIGLAASDGVIYSPYAAGFPAFIITRDNQVRFIDDAEAQMQGLPPGIWNAGAGSDVLVDDARSVAPSGTSSFLGVNPRTAIGIDRDTNTLVLMTVDGRRAGLSEGVTLVELAELMLGYGVEEAINLDGGGSTTMVLADPTPRVVNLTTGGQRANGSSLAVFAVPVEQEFDEYVFRQGLNGYVGVLDKELRAAGGDEADTAPVIVVDADTDEAAAGLQPSQGVIRFSGIIGLEPSQIPPGTQVLSAVLRLRVIDPGSGFAAYRIVRPWTASSTWVSLGGNGITPGVEATGPALATFGAPGDEEHLAAGMVEIDVTGLVQLSADGSPDQHGVALLPLTGGTDAVGFSSSEGADPPALVVRTTPRGRAELVFTQGSQGYAGARDTQLREASPSTSYAASTSLSVDASDAGGEIHVLLRFEGLFGLAAGRIPPGARIVSAALELDTVNTGSGADLHRLLASWESQDTWASSFGADGVQPDGIEAIAMADAGTPGTAGSIRVDVTRSLQAWQGDPSSNHGWVLLPRGGDGWDFASSEAPGPTGEQSELPRRPRLSVTIDAPCPGDVDASGGVDLFDVLRFFDLLVRGDLIADVSGDGALDILDIFGYFELLTAPC